MNNSLKLEDLVPVYRKLNEGCNLTDNAIIEILRNSDDGFHTMDDIKKHSALLLAVLCKNNPLARKYYVNDSDDMVIGLFNEDGTLFLSVVVSKKYEHMFKCDNIHTPIRVMKIEESIAWMKKYLGMR